MRTMLMVRLLPVAAMAAGFALTPIASHARALDVPSAPPVLESDLLVAADRGISLDQAVRIVRKQYAGATVLKAETRTSGGRVLHHVKILTSSGRVRTVKVDGRGRIV